MPFGPFALLVCTQNEMDPSADLGEVWIVWRFLESRSCASFNMVKSHGLTLVTLQYSSRTWPSSLQKGYVEFWKLWLALWAVNFLTAKYSRETLESECWTPFLLPCVVISNIEVFCVWEQTWKLSEIEFLIFTEQCELFEILKLWWEDTGTGTHFCGRELTVTIQISLPSRLHTLFWAMTAE